MRFKIVDTPGLVNSFNPIQANAVASRGVPLFSDVRLIATRSDSKHPSSRFPLRCCHSCPRGTLTGYQSSKTALVVSIQVRMPSSQSL